MRYITAPNGIKLRVCEPFNWIEHTEAFYEIYVANHMFFYNPPSKTLRLVNHGDLHLTFEVKSFASASKIVKSFADGMGDSLENTIFTLKK